MDCKNCGGCCNHVSLEIDKPTSKREYQEILWLLLHKDVRVYTDQDNDWFVEFQAQCEWRKNDKCNNHTERPVICKDYSSEDCVKNGDGSAEKLSFDCYDDFMSYIKKKKINYKFKWQQ